MAAFLKGDCSSEPVTINQIFSDTAALFENSLTYNMDKTSIQDTSASFKTLDQELPIIRDFQDLPSANNFLTSASAAKDHSADTSLPREADTYLGDKSRNNTASPTNNDQEPLSHPGPLGSQTFPHLAPPTEVQSQQAPNFSSRGENTMLINATQDLFANPTGTELLASVRKVPSSAGYPVMPHHGCQDLNSAQGQQAPDFLLREENTILIKVARDPAENSTGTVRSPSTSVSKRSPTAGCSEMPHHGCQDLNPPLGKNKAAQDSPDTGAERLTCSGLKIPSSAGLLATPQGDQEAPNFLLREENTLIKGTQDPAENCHEQTPPSSTGFNFKRHTDLGLSMAMGELEAATMDTCGRMWLPCRAPLWVTEMVWSIVL